MSNEVICPYCSQKQVILWHRPGAEGEHDCDNLECDGKFIVIINHTVSYTTYKIDEYQNKYEQLQTKSI